MDLKESALKNKIEYAACLPAEGFSDYRSLFVILIPYYCGGRDSYFSKYTRGEDYHKFGRRLMEKILSDAGETDHKILIDASPLHELSLAYAAGLGKKGKNGLIINEKYGSYVFIATALLKTEAEFHSPPAGECLNCGRCVINCPGKAISENGIDYKKCLSLITQSSKIDEAQEKLIKECGSAWGCDICQDCCPMNENVSETPFEELKVDLLLNMDDINELSQKQFKEKYKNYALSYKGRNIIRRNINLLK